MKSRAKGTPKPHGQLRQSQVVTTFGPGTMIDLPNHAVILGGLECWGDPVQSDFRLVREERLLEKVKRVLGRDELTMYAPPIDTGAASDGPPSGITAWQFPEWFVAQYDEVRRDGGRSRPLVPRGMLSRGKYIGPDRKSYPVVPIRFVQACANGHISDIDWHRFVHSNKGSCRRRLHLDERGTSGDFSDVLVRCECGEGTRTLANALPQEGSQAPLGYCNGKRPWLGANAGETCDDGSGKPLRNRLLVRSASNAYFPQILSVISIPESDEKIKKAVDLVWQDYLQYVEDIGDLRKERKKAKVAAALEGHADADVYAEIQRRKSGLTPPDKSIKQAEIETLLVRKGSVGDDTPDGTFYATDHPLSFERTGPMAKLSRLVLVHRLREVTAQVGFTRFEAAVPDINGELSLEVRRAPLSREAPWVPAVENRGEGIFLSFEREELDAWARRDPVKKRISALCVGFENWTTAHPKAKVEFPGARYVFLHSLSHLLITAVSLACGYAASSIRERIYATESGYGILLFTGTPDAEGTLGGLVDVGRHLDTHLRAALEYGLLCSNDPVCAHHRPDNRHEERYLHGAACHGCLLIAEPSCERNNEYLDRALVVSTVEGLEAEFFSSASLA